MITFTLNCKEEFYSFLINSKVLGPNHRTYTLKNDTTTIGEYTNSELKKIYKSELIAYPIYIEWGKRNGEQNNG